ncbi:MAG: D-alanyl-D-alanine carboxypeptidase family protein, partial [Proteobacteria bacterium]|nr:D-alanyl-D-alanine carboxypeptidase family protein [Pseudomonadota bacterium]
DPNRPKTRLGYTGHEHFNKLGLVNMKGRIYDAHMGRFLQPDPFVPEPGNSQSWNRYSYVVNNPLNWTDPSGFDHHDRCDGSNCPTPEQLICFYGACISKQDIKWAGRQIGKGAKKTGGFFKKLGGKIKNFLTGGDGGGSTPPPEPTPTGEGDPPGPDTFQTETPHASEFRAPNFTYWTGPAGRLTDFGEPDPSQLVTVDRFANPAGENTGGRRFQLTADTATALRSMREAAAADGLNVSRSLTLTSAYRSVARQTQLWNDALIDHNGNAAAARRFVAPPGSTEHHTGRAVDLVLDPSIGPTNRQNVPALRNTPAYRWLQNNAGGFGFNPYSSEPWHWSYNKGFSLL